MGLVGTKTSLKVRIKDTSERNKELYNSSIVYITKKDTSILGLEMDPKKVEGIRLAIQQLWQKMSQNLVLY